MTDDKSEEATQEPEPAGDDRRGDVNPADGPVPTNPPREEGRTEQGEEQLDRVGK